MKLVDRSAIVTGAGRGIGEAIAVAYAREGADLVLCSRTMSEIERTAMIVRSYGRKAIAIRADVSNKDDANGMVERAIGEFGKVDILVNNAGILGPVGLLYENDPELWATTIQVNLIGTYLCCAAVLPHMMKNCHGKIINLSGGGAANPRPRFSAYAASKAAVVRLTETLADEMKPYDIQVNAIAPGAVNTRMLDQVLAAGRRAGESVPSQAQKRKDSGGTNPELAAALAVFLASDESNGLTGRLISAVWDNWKDLPKNLQQVMQSDLYTLRRIVR